MVDKPKPQSTTEDEREKSNLAGIEALLPIDEHALEAVARDQPDAFYRTSKRLALLISRRDAAKQNLATVESEIDLAIRREAMENDEKVTVQEVEARRRTHHKVKEAQEALNRISYWTGQYSALKEAFEQRSYALNHLVTLFTANYYSEVSDKGSNNRIKDATAERSRRDMAEMRRTRNVSG